MKSNELMASQPLYTAHSSGAFHFKCTVVVILLLTVSSRILETNGSGLSGGMIMYWFCIMGG